MAVDPSKVRELREKTGLPMMECKKALEKSNGDVDKAIEELRKAGAKAQEKLGSRAANEGRIGSHRSADGREGILVTLCCETEPVAKNENFTAFLADVVQAVSKHRPSTLEALEEASLSSGKSVKEGLTELVNQLRENIRIGGFARLEGDLVSQYVHFDNKKAAMVAFSGAGKSEASDKLGENLCMHVVFHKPTSLSRDKVDPTRIAKEREICLAAAKNDPKNAKKPEEILTKIVEGQINKWIKDQCFLDQPYIRDEKLTVSEFVKQSGTGLSIQDFVYLATDLV